MVVPLSTLSLPLIALIKPFCVFFPRPVLLTPCNTGQIAEKGVIQQMFISLNQCGKERMGEGEGDVFEDVDFSPRSSHEREERK